MTRSLELSWELTVDVEPGQAETLARSLRPETDDHATLEVEDGRLRASGAGDPGTCLHTLDDILACLTGALDALEAGSGTEGG